MSLFLFDDILLVARAWENPEGKGVAVATSSRQRFTTQLKIPLKNMSVTDISGLEGGALPLSISGHISFAIS